MILCSCNNLTDTDLRHAVRASQGSCAETADSTPRTIFRHCGHRICCGNCLNSIRRQIDSELSAFRACGEATGDPIPVEALMTEILGA